MKEFDTECICDKFEMIGSLIYAMVDYVPNYGDDKAVHDRFENLFYILEEEFNLTIKDFREKLNQQALNRDKAQNSNDELDDVQATIERLKKRIK